MGKSGGGGNQVQQITPAPGSGQTAAQLWLQDVLSNSGAEMVGAWHGPYHGYGPRDLLAQNPFYQGAQFQKFDPQQFQQNLHKNWGYNNLNQGFQPLQYPIPGQTAPPPAPPPAPLHKPPKEVA